MGFKICINHLSASLLQIVEMLPKIIINGQRQPKTISSTKTEQFHFVSAYFFLLRNWVGRKFNNNPQEVEQHIIVLSL